MFDRVEVVNRKAYFMHEMIVSRLKVEHVYFTIKNYTIGYDKIWIFDKIQ